MRYSLPLASAVALLFPLTLSACAGGGAQDHIVSADSGANDRAEAAAAYDARVTEVYTPDPGPTCASLGQMPGSLITCDAGGGNAPMYNDFGTPCFACPLDGPPLPAMGCSVHQTAAIAGGQMIRPERDVWCVPSCAVCHEPVGTCHGTIVVGICVEGQGAS